MALQVDLLPIFEDNYVFVLSGAHGNAFVVDPGEAETVYDFLVRKKLRLNGILVTHHHADHIGGVQRLRELMLRDSGGQINIIAPLLNQRQIPGAELYVAGGENINVLGHDCAVMAVPGHTMGHVAYYFAEEGLLFSGDVIFGLGCGRLFEGTPETAYESLQLFKRLPPQTKIFCTHEYTERNLRFCRELAANKKFQYGECRADLEQYAADFTVPSVPLLLSGEVKVNPFLRANDAAEFAEIRRLRNEFKG